VIPAQPVENYFEGFITYTQTGQDYFAKTLLVSQFPDRLSFCYTVIVVWVLDQNSGCQAHGLPPSKLSVPPVVRWMSCHCIIICLPRDGFAWEDQDQSLFPHEGQLSG
jgi:hypothetical protein